MVEQEILSAGANVLVEKRDKYEQWEKFWKEHVREESDEIFVIGHDGQQRKAHILSHPINFYTAIGYEDLGRLYYIPAPPTIHQQTLAAKKNNPEKEWGANSPKNQTARRPIKSR